MTRALPVRRLFAPLMMVAVTTETGAGSMKLDLMKEKPAIDVPTLNWVWDRLWRRHACMKPRNAAMRAVRSELEMLMDELELEAERTKQ